MFATIERMFDVYLRRRVTFLAALSFAIASALHLAAPSDGSGRPIEHVVGQGDTLWSIATSLGGDPRKRVYQLRRLNDLATSTIQPGQVLVLPSA